MEKHIIKYGNVLFNGPHFIYELKDDLIPYSKYLDLNIRSYVDITSFRPDPSYFMKENKRYNAVLYFDRLKTCSDDEIISLRKIELSPDKLIIRIR